VLDRVTSTGFAAAAGAAALVVFLLAFAAGRFTAPSSAASAPALAPLHSSAPAISLPHLSQAVPLAGLRQAPAPVVRSVPAAAAPIVPRVRRSKPKKPGGPVDIVGSG